jgi:hypothetical protein
MRRAGGWVLGLLAVAAMAGGAWFALRPLFQRETIDIVFLRSVQGRDPTDDAIESGARFALAEAGGRAGGYRLSLVPVKGSLVERPIIFLGPGEAIAARGSNAILNVAALDSPLWSAGDVKFMSGFDVLAAAAGRWALRKGAKRIALVEDSGLRGRNVRQSFEEWATGQGLEICALPHPSLDLAERLRVTLEGKPDLVFYTGEEPPYTATEAFFEALVERGFRGILLTVDVDPEVSFLALPSTFPAGTMLLSPLSPPSAEFAARYEPATGRKAGPHAWPGYLAMRWALDVLERTRSLDSDDVKCAVREVPPPKRVLSLYSVKDGDFIFVEGIPY